MNNFKKIRLTLNLSEHLLKTAGRLFGMKRKTNIIHEALRRCVDAQKKSKNIMTEALFAPEDEIKDWYN